MAPNPVDWTLKFKYNITTIIIVADPLMPIAELKVKLHQALKENHPDGLINGVTIPADPAVLRFGIPKDQNDLSAGFKPVEPENTFSEEEMADSKGKGKAAASTAKTSKTSMKDCPKGAGMRDHGIVAFKFHFDNTFPAGGREDADFDSIKVAAEDEEEEWDVVNPSMEDTYGDANAVVVNDDNEVVVTANTSNYVALNG